MPVRRRSLLATVTAVSLAVLGRPAASIDLPSPVRPRMSVTLSHTAFSQTVCGNGTLRSGPAIEPVWTMLTVGARSDGSLIFDSLTTVGPEFHYCYTVPKQGAEKGNFATVLAYLGVGDDLPSVLAGAGLWDGPDDNEVEASQ